MGAKKDHRHRLKALEAQAGRASGRARKGLRLNDYGELGSLTAKAFVAWERLRHDAEAPAYCHQLVRSLSFALLTMGHTDEITDSLRTELRAIFQSTRPSVPPHRWQADKHLDALALYEQLRREKHL